jgi:nitrous oxide reductase
MGIATAMVVGAAVTGIGTAVAAGQAAKSERRARSNKNRLMDELDEGCCFFGGYDSRQLRYDFKSI